MLKPFEYILLLLLVGVIGIVLYRTQNSTSGQPQIFMLPGGDFGRSASSTDDRYRMAPRPQRFWDNGPEIPVRGALDPIPTRGEPEAYQQMGVIVGTDGKPLPLYGRRTAPRSDRFNYYTRTDQYNPVALPLSFKRRDCQDGVGCDELMSGDEVKMAATGDVGKVTLYGFDGPRYVG